MTRLRNPLSARVFSPMPRLSIAAVLIAQLALFSVARGQAGPFTEPGRIEAENASRFQGTVSANSAGFSGTGYVNTPNTLNTYIEWDLNLPAGVYYAHFRYSDGGSSSRGATLLLNGAPVGSVLPFPPTGAGRNWELTPVTAFTPAAGVTNTLRLRADTSRGLSDIDYIEISTNPEIAYQLTVANGSGSGVYEVDAVVPVVAESRATPFLKWTGNVSNAQNVNAAATTVRMAALPGNATVTATYVEPRPPTHGQWMANSIMARYPGIFNDGGDSWDYQKGVVLRGFEEIWSVTGDQKYFDYIKSTMDSAISSAGNISGYNSTIYSLDEIRQTDLSLFLYRQTGDNRYRLAADRVRAQLTTQPRTDSGGFWHRANYPHQMWLDGLYMAQPFYCEYSKMFNQPEYFDDVAYQLKLMRVRAVDSVTGLLYHGWDESKVAAWANPETGCSPVFWSRSMGWYAMALVDVLDHLPADHSDRGDLIQILRSLCAALLAVRDPQSGVWWQVPDHPKESNNYEESSGGLMFIYAFSKGARLGYLDPAYRAVAEQAFQDHIAAFTYEGSDGRLNLTRTCRGTGVGDSLAFYYDRAYYTNDTKGIGPFMMASAEIEFRQMPALYTLTVINGSGGGQYSPGSAVQVSATPPSEDRVFLRWSGETDGLADPFSSTTSLVMPSNDLTIQALFATPAGVSSAVWPAYGKR